MIRAYIDYQNAYRMLKDKAGFCLLSLRMGALIAELLASVGERSATTHRAFSGLASADVDAPARTRRIRQFDALRHHEGISVFTRDYAYRKNTEGFLQSREKGIDVRLGCELVAAAAQGDIGGALLWSADQDLAEAVTVARELAAAKRRPFKVYGVELDGIKPVAGTIPILLSRPMLYRNLRGEGSGDADGETRTTA
jgi:hypothetical protein